MRKCLFKIHKSENKDPVSKGVTLTNKLPIYVKLKVIATVQRKVSTLWWVKVLITSVVGKGRWSQHYPRWERLTMVRLTISFRLINPLQSPERSYFNWYDVVLCVCPYFVPFLRFGLRPPSNHFDFYSTKDPPATFCLCFKFVFTPFKWNWVGKEISKWILIENL